MKVAIVHEWFSSYAGSEKVVEQILHCYPDADVFAVCDFLKPNDRHFLNNKKVTTTFIQRLPFASKKFQSYLPLMPLAIEQLDMSEYDVIISSSHAVSKGVITGPDQIHISYVHSPIRYAWDFQHQYLRESGLDKGLKGLLAKYLLHKIRIWDYRTAAGVNHFIGNSNFIARRINKVYGRQADVIYPPVNTEKFEFSDSKEDFYLAA
ncbi:glycosyltransferase family 4 protein, partial [Salmonella enterica]|nr:glycosyltransferase family 4 protein [Salmonella enterica]